MQTRKWAIKTPFTLVMFCPRWSRKYHHAHLWTNISVNNYIELSNHWIFLQWLRMTSVRCRISGHLNKVTRRVSQSINSAVLKTITCLLLEIRFALKRLSKFCLMPKIRLCSVTSILQCRSVVWAILFMYLESNLVFGPWSCIDIKFRYWSIPDVLTVENPNPPFLRCKGLQVNFENTLQGQTLHV